MRRRPGIPPAGAGLFGQELSRTEARFDRGTRAIVLTGLVGHAACCTTTIRSFLFFKQHHDSAELVAFRKKRNVRMTPGPRYRSARAKSGLPVAEPRWHCVRRAWQWPRLARPLWPAGGPLTAPARIRPAGRAV